MNNISDTYKNEPKRYTASGNGIVKLDPKGELVLLSDYAALQAFTVILDRHEEIQYKSRAEFEEAFKKSKAENARLKAEVEMTKAWSAKEPYPSRLYQQMAEENARLKAEVERLTEGNECLNAFHDKEMERSAYLLEEFNRTTAWGRGLESDLSHARVESSFLKAEVERLSAADSYLQAENEHSFEQRCDEWEAENERLRKAGDAMAREICILGPVDDKEKKAIAEWNDAKEGKPSA